jgi:hypothetical protein
VGIEASSYLITAGDAGTDVHASVGDSVDTPTWRLTGPGTLSATTGRDVHYTPPGTEALDQTTQVTITMSLPGAPDASISITVYSAPGHVFTALAAQVAGESPPDLVAVAGADDGRLAGIDASQRLLASADGLAWSPVVPVSSSAPQPFAAYAVSWAAGRFVAAMRFKDGVGAEQFLASTDGVTWNASNAIPFQDDHGMNCPAIAHDGTQYVCDDGGQYLASVDGLSWSHVGWGGNLPATGFAVGAGRYVFANLLGQLGSSASPEASFSTNWGNTNDGWLAIAWNGERFSAVGMDGATRASTDGLSGVEGTSGTTVHLRAVAGVPGQFIAVGDGGTILASADGLTWQPRASGTTLALRGIARAAGRWIVVGDGGTVLVSDH